MKGSRARFEVFTVVKIQDEVLWVVKLSIVVVGYKRFGEPCCLHVYLNFNGNQIVAITTESPS
jgi:hypothetical protein